MAGDDPPMHASSDMQNADMPSLHTETATEDGESSALGAPREGAGASMSALNPWLFMICYVFIQMLLSPYWPSAGVHAETSDMAMSTESEHSHPYYQALPPILNSSQASGTIVSESMTDARRLKLREEAKQMFIDGYQAYLDHAFPMDELNPVACKGRGSDKFNDNNLNVNDVLGDFSLTLIDSLDTLATIREPHLFQEAVDRVLRVVHFEVNSRVQVFEVNIRVLGALLSAHLYATDPRLNSTIPGYKGELLHLASDLGKRLMRSFENTLTGIPWPRVNLKKGVLYYERTETCAAGAGSLLLEFGVLSRLTGDPSFENAAKNALRQLWARRTGLGLVGNAINIQTGEWLSAIAGVGAGTDSFYEYLLKSYILFGDTEYLDMYESASTAIRQHLLHETGYFYKHIHITEGHLLANWVDSLSAFLPGVQVLAGDLESAIKNHLYYFNIWRKFQAIPERFNFITQETEIPNYPLRPEFIESTYFLYRATKDPFYLQVGEMVLRDLQRFTKTRCGWASLASVKTKEKEDRMESFALSETFKYLFLLFDEENVLHQDFKDSNFVFSTEGHVLYLRNQHLDQTRLTFNTTHQQKSFTSDSDEKRGSLWRKSADTTFLTDFEPPLPQRTCKVPQLPNTFLKGIAYRPDFDFARQLVGVAPDARDLVEPDPAGYCDRPQFELDQVTVEFSGLPAKTFYQTGEDEETGVREAREYHHQMHGRSAPPVHIRSLKSDGRLEGVYIDRLVGVQLRLVYDPSYKGYRANRVDGHAVHPMEPIYVDLTSMQPLYDSFQRQQDAHLRIVRPIWGPEGDRDDKDAAGEMEVEEINLLISPAAFGPWRPLLDTYDPLVIKRRRVTDKAASSWSSSNNSPLNSQDQKMSIDDNGYQHGMEGLMPDGFGSNEQVDAADDKSGGNFSGSKKKKSKRRRMPSLPTSELVRIMDNTHGCRPYRVQEQAQVQGKMVVVDRGACLFILKAYYAQVAGATGVIVINNDDRLFQITGSATSQEETSPGGGQSAHRQSEGMVIGDSLKDDSINIPTVMLRQQQGLQLLQWIQQDQNSKNSRDDYSSTKKTGYKEQGGEQEHDMEQTGKTYPSHSNSPQMMTNESENHRGAQGADDNDALLDPLSISAAGYKQGAQQRLRNPSPQPRKRQRGIQAMFVQQKLKRESLEKARLTYNNFPILNIHTIARFRELQ